jgi:predicted MFS family arabinose efflux permease
MILGGGLMLIVFEHAGWVAAFLAMSGMLLASTGPILAYREVPRPPPERTSVLAGVAAALARPGMRRWLLVLLTFKTGEWFATAMLRPLFTDEGLTKADIGAVFGIAGFGAALLGALTGGALTPWLGRRRALLAFGSLQALGIASLVLAVRYPSMEVFYAVTCVEHFTSSMATAALFTAMMDCCRVDEAGTDYTVQASLVVIATGVSSALSGVSAGAIGYGAHFLAAAGVSLVGVIVVLVYRPSDPAFALLGPRSAG